MSTIKTINKLDSFGITSGEELTAIVDLCNVTMPSQLTEFTKGSGSSLDVDIDTTTKLKQTTYASWMKVSKLQAVQLLVIIDNLQEQLEQTKYDITDQLLHKPQ